jgi:hypothetical protein
VVDDLDVAIAEYSALSAIGGRRAYLYAPETVPELRYRGVALSDSSPQIELIQSLIEVPRARRKPDREWTNARPPPDTRSYVAATVAAFTPIRSPDSASNRRSDSSRTRK